MKNNNAKMQKHSKLRISSLILIDFSEYQNKGVEGKETPTEHSYLLGIILWESFKSART